MVQALVCALPAAPQQGGPPGCVQGAQGRRPPFRITWQASSEPRRPGKVEPAGTPYPSVNESDASPPSRDRKFRTEQLCRRILLRIVFPGSCFGLERAQRSEGRAKKCSRRGPCPVPKTMQCSRKLSPTSVPRRKTDREGSTANLCRGPGRSHLGSFEPVIGPPGPRGPFPLREGTPMMPGTEPPAPECD